jgi:hypothetical protein
MSNALSGLPISANQRPPSEHDMRIMEAMFGSSSAGYEIKKLIVPGALFLALSLPFVDRLLKGVITTSDLVLLVIKTGLFLALLLVAQLFGLA